MMEGSGADTTSSTELRVVGYFIKGNDSGSKTKLPIPVFKSILEHPIHAIVNKTSGVKHKGCDCTV